MHIRKITKNKQDFLDILLIGDENEAMIAKYIDKSTLFALYVDNVLMSVCAVAKINDETVEIKNIATYPRHQNCGYASVLIEYVCNEYKNRFKYLILGTGENLKTLNFYKKRGFFMTHRVKNFFIDNYSHPIFEDGVQLIDMVYLRKIL